MYRKSYVTYNVMYRTMLCTVKCYVTYNVMYRTMLCTVQCYVPYNVMYRTMLCTVQCYVMYNLFPIIYSAILLNVLSSFVDVSIVRCFNSIIGFFLMYSFITICSYVAVCRFCAVRRVIIICFRLLFSSYPTYVF